MKLKILSTDQIVGLVIILALASLAFVIVMLGQAQRWFAKDMDFRTELSTAEGLSKNMAIQYKGFTIGNVTNFKLNKETEMVDVFLTIHEDYTGMVTEGSIVELQVGFISLLGSQFLFHPGKGKDPLKGNLIPALDSDDAKELIRREMATITPSDDSIARILNQVNSLLGGVNLLLADLNADLGPDESHTTDIGKLIGGISTTVNDIPQILDSTIDGVLNPVLAELRPLLNHVDDLLATLNEPGGIITMLDSDGALNETIGSLPDLIGSLNDAIAPLPGLLENLDNTTASLPSQLPTLLSQLRTVLRSVDDVLIGLANNPLLRGGVPERPVTQTTGPRDIRF